MFSFFGGSQASDEVTKTLAGRSPELLKSEKILRSAGERHKGSAAWRLAAMQANFTDDSNSKLPGEIQTRLQLDLSTADRELRRALNNFWSSAAHLPFSILDHQHAELIPLFEIYGTDVLHARADALVRLGQNIPEVKALLEQKLIPQTIDLIVPACVIPSSLLEPSDLSLMIIDYSSDGCWEYWLRLTWENFAATQASLPDLDTWWRHQFQIVLRFPDHRKPFISRLQQHLTRSIVDWEPDAWRLKLESSTTPLALDARVDEILSLVGRSHHWTAEALKRARELETGQTPLAEPKGNMPESHADPVAAERTAQLAEFKARGKTARISITDEMVAKAANPGAWNDRTPVTRWKRGDPRCSLTHDRKIRAVLARDPAAIWRAR